MREGTRGELAGAERLAQRALRREMLREMLRLVAHQPRKGSALEQSMTR